MRRPATIFFVVTGITYPFLVFYGLRYLEPRYLAFILGIILMIRLIPGLRVKTQRRNLRHSLSLPVALIGLVYLATLIFNEGRIFLFVPALVSISLLIGFGRSLFRPPSMVETFARMKEKDLSEEKVEYCRRVTMVWIGFFIFNAVLSAYLGYRGDMTVWTLYNGSIVYVLMGVLFGGEYLYRQVRFGS